MNPKALIRVLLETSGHADQNVAKFLARDTDALMDAMRGGKVDELLRGSAEGRALLNNAEFMRMTTKVSGNLDYITRAGRDLSAGRPINATEFLNKMDIPAQGNVGSTLTRSISDFNGVAARSANTTANNADTIAAARRARPTGPSADEVAEQLKRAKAGADEAVPPPGGGKPGVHAADNAADAAAERAAKKAAEEAARRSAMPPLSSHDAKALRALANDGNGYASKIELLLNRNVSPEEHARWMNQILVNSRRSHLKPDDMQRIEDLAERTGRLSADEVSKFREVASLHARGFTGKPAQTIDSLKASFENAALHPFRTAGSLYTQSLLAPVAVPFRTLGWANAHRGTTALLGGSGIAVITASDMSTNGATSQWIKSRMDTFLTEGYSQWGDWASLNISTGARALGFVGGFFDKDAARRWTENSVSYAADIGRNMPQTAANLLGVERSTINTMASIPVLGIPFRGLHAGDLLASATDAANGGTVPSQSIHVADSRNTVALAEDDTRKTTNLRQRAVNAASAGKDAFEQGLEGLENLELGNIMRDPEAAWSRFKTVAAGNPAMQKAMDIAEQNPMLKWGLIGGFALGAAGEAHSPAQRIANGLKSAMVLGALLDLMGALFGKPSLIVSTVRNAMNNNHSDQNPSGAKFVPAPAAPGVTPAPVQDVASAPVQSVANAPVQSVASAPVQSVASAPVQSVASAPAPLKENFTAQAAAPVPEVQPDPASTSFAFRNATLNTTTPVAPTLATPALATPALAANDPDYRRSIFMPSSM